MGNLWTKLYLFVNSKQNDNHAVIPNLIGQHVNAAYKNVIMWFPDYKVLSIPNIGYTDVALERKEMVIIHFNPINNLVTLVEVF